MRRPTTVLVFILSLSACWVDSSAGDSFVAAARQVDVLDGDSLVIKQGKHEIGVRLFGIDAPEHRQPWSDQARSALGKLIRGQDLRIEEVDKDRYDRVVAYVYAGHSKTSVNEAMIAAGHAWVFRRYTRNRQWIRLENAARKQGIGLWQLAPAQRQPPWEWREAGS